MGTWTSQKLTSWAGPHLDERYSRADPFFTKRASAALSNSAAWNFGTLRGLAWPFFKGTRCSVIQPSVTSQISVEELTAMANHIQAETFRPFEAYILVAVLYLALSLLMRLVLWLSGQLVFSRQRALRGRS